MLALHKSKQYLLALGKVLVLSITFGYIFYRLQNNAEVDFPYFLQSISARGKTAGYFLTVALILTALNWYFEILKWQNLVSVVKNISFKTALKQCLVSLTISLATPNRIGEYGAKALFFKRKARKKILLLNLLANLSQLSATIFFGMIGLYYFIQKFEVTYSFVPILVVALGIVLFIGVGYFFRKRELFLKGFSLIKIFQFHKTLPRLLILKVFLLSIVRYLVFSIMFYGLLIFFGAKTSVFTGMALIFAMYLLVSIIPTIFIFDVVVRGGVAVWLFSYAGIAELTILSTVLAMWILNFVLPAILGSFMVISYQPSTQ